MPLKCIKYVVLFSDFVQKLFSIISDFIKKLFFFP